jgi:hypothetical protein
LDGIDSSYAVQLDVCPKMLGADVLHFFDGLQSLANWVNPDNPRPAVIPT